VIVLAVAALLLLIGSRYLAGEWIDYQWWLEMHQLDTWFSQLLYGT
jgi:hypothetical protein